MRNYIFFRDIFRLTLFFGFICVLNLSAQNSDKLKFTFLGKVIDLNNQPIENVTIYGNQGSVICYSQPNGTFTINVNQNTDILIEKTGYFPITINSSGKVNVITLKPNKSYFGNNSILTTAYHSENRNLMVGNIASINVPDIIAIDNTNTFQSILETYGIGNRNGINLLGIGDALVLVDGLPRDASLLMPEEIENITIVKDVNSYVLYGSQAQNGVIQVNTKRGVANKKVTKFSFEKGLISPIQIPKYLNSKNYLKLFSEAQINDNPNKMPDYSESDINNYNGQNPYRYPDINYYGSDFLKPVSSSTRFIGEFSGGNRIATYYTNIGWEHQDALYKSDTYNYGIDKLRVRANVNYNVTDKISSYLDAAFVLDVSKTPRTDFFAMASTYRPNDYTPLIPLNMFDDPTLTGALSKLGGNYILGGQGLTSKNTYGKNIYGELNSAGYSTNFSQTMQLNAGVKFNLNSFINGLNLDGNISFDNHGRFSQEIQNTYAIYEPIWNNVTGKISGLNTINNDTHTGVLTLTSGGFYRNIMSRISLDYDRSFRNNHNLSASLFGYYSRATVENSIHANKDAHIGIRSDYNYNEKYIIKFNGSIMNSDKLAQGNRISFSPSLGLGWIISSENFWDKQSFVKSFKLKATAGILNTDASPYFGYNLYKQIYSGGSAFSTGDVGGYNYSSMFISQTENLNLRPEKMINYNFGFETSLFENSLYIDANYFYTKYKDQVVQRLNHYPTLMSSFVPFENYNETDYQGVDVTAVYKKQFGEFLFSAGLTVLFAESKYVKVDEIHENGFQYYTGTAPDAFRGLTFTGFFASDAQAQSAHQQYGTIRRGDMSYLDLDGNGYVNDNDMSVLGNYNPRFTEKLNLNFGFKNFSLLIATQSQLGYNWVMSSTENRNPYFWVDGNTKYSEMVLNRWTDQTATTASYPRLTAQTSTNNFINSNFWIRNGDYFSIGKLQLNYMVTKRMLRDTFIKDVNIYLNGSNLLFLAQDAALRQTNSYIQTRNFSLGVKMSF
ncbi:MAG: SusC/RagA family TonB-linked outer membrane protein [Paludibacter sp.]|nr:SusC/RagA family TonB-linked outer membrane protein [Paludibacter sp.]